LFFIGNDMVIKRDSYKIEGSENYYWNDKVRENFGATYLNILGLNLSNNPIYLFNIINHDDNISQ
jgi:hypothetical protein